jgi:hypothetical protein
MAGMQAQRRALAGLLAEGRRQTPHLVSALMLAIDFRTWEVLVQEGRLEPEAAADLVAGWIE